MKATVKPIVLCLLIFSACSQAFGQEIRYIRDKLWVPLRSGTTLQHRIVHKGLVSGTKVTILEMTEDDKYSRVRTDRGMEGWIQTQYLSDEPAGRDLLAAAEKKVLAIGNQNKKLQQQIAELQQQEQALSQQLASITNQQTSTSDELDEIKAISSNALQLDKDNKRLLQENQMLKNEVDVLSTDNQRLNDDKENDAFLNGAFAVLIGVMLALIIPRLAPKKRDEWS